MAEGQKNSVGLSTELLLAISHGCVASLLCGLGCIICQPWLRELLLSQSEPTISFALYLFICAQIGTAVSVVIAVMATEKSRS